MRVVNFDKCQIDFARRLIDLGARSAIVAAALGITGGQARHLYVGLAGRPSASGQLPSNPGWYFANPTVLVQSSLFSNLYDHYGAHENGNVARTFLHAYEAYLLTVGKRDAALNIDRAWYLTRFVPNQIQKIKCMLCSVPFLAEHYQIRADFKCPACKRASNKLH